MRGLPEHHLFHPGIVTSTFVAAYTRMPCAPGGYTPAARIGLRTLAAPPWGGKATKANS